MIKMIKQYIEAAVFFQEEKLCVKINNIILFKKSLSSE